MLRFFLYPQDEPLSSDKLILTRKYFFYKRMNTNWKNLHTVNMKKTLTILTSLLAALGATRLAGLSTHYDTDGKPVILCVQGGNYDVAGMPKVRFEFKDGTPV